MNTVLSPRPGQSASNPGLHSRQQAQTAARREFPFEKRHFSAIAKLLYRLTGISLAEHKTELVYSRLSRRLRDLRMVDFDSYCELLDSPEGEQEISFLVNALTTNLTSFFRESHHFDHLGDAFLPQLAAARSGQSKPRLRIWSAGCSSGQEPYCIAMILAKVLDSNLKRWDARILATDIDTHMVETAERGVYSVDQAAGIPTALRERYCERLREQPGGRSGNRSTSSVAMGDELRRLITFKPLNLLEPWPMGGPFDAIFCRNVLIYFDRAGRQRIISQFAGLLAPGGLLFLGHSESLQRTSDGLQQVGPTIYRKC